MWKSAVGHNVNVQDQGGDDDWDTDADFVNDVSEKEQRWGSKSVAGSGKPQDAVDLGSLRNQIASKNEEATKKEYQSKPGFSYGYGGKFGVQTDRMDKSAVGYESMTAPSSTHSSIPKYERPAVAVKPTDIKKKFESAANSAADLAKIEEARKERSERERAERERIRLELEAKRAKELEEAKNEEEKRRIEEAQEKARREEEEARKKAEEEEARLAAIAQERIERKQEAEEKGSTSNLGESPITPSEQNAESQYSEYVEGEKASGFDGGFSATAIYEYEATGDDEVGFNEGDVITNIEMIDEGWWRGECNGRYGLFPANYVQAN